MSGWGAYWLGMNYPVRFIFFGGALLALCWLLRGRLQARHLYTTSKAMGLTYLFVALWIMSIFGNYDIDNWYGVTQLRCYRGRCCSPWRRCSAFTSALKPTTACCAVLA